MWMMKSIAVASVTVVYLLLTCAPPAAHLCSPVCTCSSVQWRYISDEDRDRLSHRSEDGEFW